jgi:hypothetical protein
VEIHQLGSVFLVPFEAEGIAHENPLDNFAYFNPPQGEGKAIKKQRQNCLTAKAAKNNEK